MSTILTAKSRNIDGNNVTGLAAITPCVGGLVVWYTSVVPREALDQKDNNDSKTETQPASQ